MLIQDKYGDFELYCDECGANMDDDEEVYQVDDQIICIYCLRRKFKKED